ncbi:hypothetical protein ACFQVA_02420 [Actinomadura keratinilytica]
MERTENSSGARERDGPGAVLDHLTTLAGGHAFLTRPSPAARTAPASPLSGRASAPSSAPRPPRRRPARDHDAGYATALIGKWHCGLPDHSPTRSGWGDATYQDLRYYTRVLTERAVEYVGRSARTRSATSRSTRRTGRRRFWNSAAPGRIPPTRWTARAWLGYLLRGERVPERDLFWRVRGERALRLEGGPGDGGARPAQEPAHGLGADRRRVAAVSGGRVRGQLTARSDRRPRRPPRARWRPGPRGAAG